MPAPGSSENQSDLLIGDDESFYSGSGFPLHFKMNPVALTTSMEKKNRSLIFLDPGLDFDDNNELVAVETPVISIQCLSNNGSPDNKNTITVRIGQYQTSSKPKEISKWTEDIKYIKLSLDLEGILS